MNKLSKNIDKIEPEEILKDLQSLGLASKEASVYMALLQLGEVGSSKIIKKTELHGQFVYQALTGLEKKGLIQHVIKRGRKKFTAKNPHILARLIDEKKRIADKVSNDLQKLLILPTEHQFEVFQGKESYIAHELDILEQASNNSELLIIGGTGDRFNEEMGEMLKKYIPLQLKKNISIRYIGSEGQRDALPAIHGKRQLFRIRYLPGLFTGQVNTNIWPHLIGFNIYSEPVTRFTVFNSVVAESYSQFFEALWKLAKE